MFENNLQHFKSLAFRLTDLCNLKCVFCGQAKQNAVEKLKNQKHFLELDELISITEQLVKYKPQVYLWGGEPLVYPKISEFIHYLRAQKLNVFITTNGVLLNKFYKNFVDEKVTELTISIEGFKECHEKVRGVYGIFDKIISNLQLLQDYKEKTNKIFPLVDINVVINTDNYKQLSEFCNYLSGLKVINKIRLQLPMFFLDDAVEEFNQYVTKYFYCSTGTSWRYFTYGYEKIDFLSLKKEIEVALQNKKVQLFPSSADVEKWFKEPNMRFKEICKTAFYRINVEPNGDLIACTDFFETVYGNALKDPVEKLFNNEVINNHRKAQLKNKLKLCSRCSHLYLY